MTVRKVRAGRRRGAVAVETALVAVVMTSFVFGVYEYCRLLMDMNLLNNAAREGCRYAQVNNTNPSIATNVRSVVTGYMAGETASFSNFTVTVTGTRGGVSTPVNNLAAGDTITVTASGTYRFMNIIPLIKMPTSLTVTSAVTMGCEGGT